jgi:hypothetical protein
MAQAVDNVAFEQIFLRVPLFSPVQAAHFSSSATLWLCRYAHSKAVSSSGCVNCAPTVTPILCHRGADSGELHERAIDRCKPTDPLK